MSLPPLTPRSFALANSASEPAIGSNYSSRSESPRASPKMRKLTDQDQGCFMIVSEACHPQLRLDFPNSTKILAGLACWIVNRLMSCSTMEEGLASIFGEGEMHLHASANVSSVADAPSYPGNLVMLVPYIPVSDEVVAWQCTAVVEYVATEVLALAGSVAMQLRDQPQFDCEEREQYKDFPTIRPSDIKTAVANDEELRKAFGALFKLEGC